MPRGKIVPELFEMDRSLGVLGGAKKIDHFTKSEDKCHGRLGFPHCLKCHR